ncbi:helix-turn-helix domain-containing protein [Actinoplanes sp. NPDC004185]
METSPQRDGAGDTPSAVRVLVGAYLRQLREDSGRSRAEAGAPLHLAEPAITAMELGRAALDERDVLALLSLYGLYGAHERAALLARVREANAPGRSHSYSDVTPNWFQRYLSLQARASLIRTYEVQSVPGLLQTEAYARALVPCRARQRLAQQQVLNRPDPPKLWALVHEAALRRPVGGRAVMRDQLEALIAVVTKSPTVRLQVLPLAAGGHATAGGSFTILRFPEPDLPDMVYLEQLTSALYLHSRADIDFYFHAANRLFVEAAPLRDTAGILERIIDDLRTRTPLRTPRDEGHPR